MLASGRSEGFYLKSLYLADDVQNHSCSGVYGSCASDADCCSPYVCETKAGSCV